MSAALPRSILFTGAKTGSLARGLRKGNRGLILKLLQDQPVHENGWVKGRFVVLEAGDGTYGAYLKAFVGRTVTVGEIQPGLLEAINATRSKSLSRLTVFDRNSLGIEEGE